MVMRAGSTGIAILFLLAGSARGEKLTWQKAVDAAMRAQPTARIAVVETKSGKLLASAQLEAAARTLAEPGSTLKPLLLFQLIAAGHWQPGQRVACARDLQIAGRRLHCSHPGLPPMDARDALAWSCNSYFAEVAAHTSPHDLETMLRKTGLLAPSGLAAQEAIATFHPAENVQETQLRFLGVEGIRITPLELAVAYRWLAAEMEKNPDSTSSQTLRAGLGDSASFGMAGGAGLGGVPVLGKTGTAERNGVAQTHGWFAGIAGDVVLVVYLPAGRGADAANLAGVVLKYSPLAGSAKP